MYDRHLRNGLTPEQARAALAVPGKNVLGFLDPLFDVALGIASPVLLGLSLAARGIVDQRNARRDASVPDTPLPEEQLPAPVTTSSPETLSPSFGYSDARLGGIPMSMLTQLGMGLMSQTPAVRLNAAKASGRRGGLKSAKRRKSKKKAPAARRVKRSRKKSTGKRLVKGSAAAKAWGKRMKARRKK